MSNSLPDKMPSIDWLANHEHTLRERLHVACLASRAAYWPSLEWDEWAAQAGAIDSGTITHQDVLRDVSVSYAVTRHLILITFRGTPVESMRAWLQNFDPMRRICLRAHVHAGFYYELTSVCGQLWDTLRPFMRGRSVVLVGHSKGGALASLAAYMRAATGEAVDGLYTFGAPRALNHEAALYVNRRVAESHRVVHSNDPIPLFPLGLVNLWRYAHTGQLRLLSEHGRINTEPTWWDVVSEWARGYRCDAVRDHLIGSYLSAITKTKTL